MSAGSPHKATFSPVLHESDRGEAAKIRKIIHIDMDAFYASVEQRDNPELKGQAVVVGGKPDGRGVVAACSYEARRFGVRSAMPSAEAGRRCPHAIFVKPRFEAYQQVSKQIQATFREFTRVVEPLSLDEAYLDVSDNTLFNGSALLLAREIKSVILDRTQLIASAGVSYNKFLAKIASDHDKPDGLFCVRPEDGEQFVASLPVGRFHGVGKVTESRMHKLGILSGADLRAWSLAELEKEFGKSADYYYHAARGIDNRPVRSTRGRKSVGAERTFSINIEDPAEMRDVLEKLCLDLLNTLQTKALTANTLSIKVRFGDFETLTRSYSHAGGVLNRHTVLRILPFLLDRALEVRRTTQNRQSQRRGHGAKKAGVRLLGASLSTLRPVDQNLPEQLEFDLSHNKT